VIDPEVIQKLKELSEKIPPDLVWDWEGTNHYELTQPSGDYWWLMPLDVGGNHDTFLPDTEEGQRLGQIIEYAVLARKVLPEMLKEMLL